MRIDPDHCDDPVLLAAEVRRLRAVIASGDALTDAEREAVTWCMGWCKGLHAKNHATLRGLLARMSGNGDCPEPDNTAGQDNADRPQPIAKCDATPDADDTPDECTVSPEWKSRPYWVDPPSGWRYGFPRLYDPARDGNMRAWMIASGYPEHLANQGLDCTFTAQTEDVG